MSPIRTSIEQAHDMGMLDRIDPEHWGKTFRVDPSDILEMIAAVQASRSTKCVPDCTPGMGDGK